MKARPIVTSPRSSIFMPGEHVYQFYEQAGNRHHRSIELYSLQAEARRAHTQIERALKLVMTHRLRPGRDSLFFLLRCDRDWQDAGMVGGGTGHGRAGALVVQLWACLSTVLASSGAG